jgi:uncharacterized membrane protein required for colicin V production
VSTLASLFSNLNLLDVIVLIIVATSVVAGVMAGFARSGIGLVFSTLGVLFGFWFYWVPAEWLHRFISSMMASNVIGFFLIFTAWLMLGALTGRFFRGLLKSIGLGWLDGLLGATFGFFRGALASVALVAVLLAFTPTPVPNWLVDSKVLPYEMGASNLLSRLAPPELKNALNTSVQEVRRIWLEELRKSHGLFEAHKKQEHNKKEQDGENQ